MLLAPARVSNANKSANERPANPKAPTRRKLRREKPSHARELRPVLMVSMEGVLRVWKEFHLLG
jgi:hypothetical protein